MIYSPPARTAADADLPLLVSPDTIPGLSRFQQTILHQGRIEAHLLADAEVGKTFSVFFLAADSSLGLQKHSKGSITVERGVIPESLTVDESLIHDPTAYPISVVLRHLSEEEANPDGLTKVGETRSGLFRSSLVSAEEEESLYKKKEQAVQLEKVSAKYVIGCDGAHSWTRRTLGIKMIGDQTK